MASAPIATEPTHAVRRVPVRFRVPLDPLNPPPRLTRRDAAEVLTRRGFKISPRTIEGWPLPVKIINGRATYSTRELLEYADRKVEEAPVIRGGRKPKPAI